MQHIKRELFSNFMPDVSISAFGCPMMNFHYYLEECFGEIASLFLPSSCEIKLFGCTHTFIHTCTLGSISWHYHYNLHSQFSESKYYGLSIYKKLQTQANSQFHVHKGNPLNLFWDMQPKNTCKQQKQHSFNVNREAHMWLRQDLRNTQQMRQFTGVLPVFSLTDIPDWDSGRLWLVSIHKSLMDPSLLIL